MDSKDDDDCRDNDWLFIDNDGTNDDDTDGDDDNESFIHNEDTDDDSADEDDDNTSHRQQQNYTILNENDICRCQEEDITKVTTVLTISRLSASILLRHYNWSVTEVNDAWFANEEKVRSEVGLLEIPVFQIPNTVKELDCGICFDSYPLHKMNAVSCGHLFCSLCWTDYISTSIDDGPGCLKLRCPEPSCRAAVDQDMINLSVYGDYDKDKYAHYLLRSYIEDNKKRKWCPAPGCNCAVDFIVGSSSNDVHCNCTYSFCWNCAEDAHSPVDCGTVAKWKAKSSSETENMNWILANSKSCPECQRPIEKNHGCMHMICPCGFHFCWLCLDAWAFHGTSTGGYMACNRYVIAKQKGVYVETEKRREMAKRALKKYIHYHERWAANQSSRRKAVRDLKKMQSVHIGKLIDKQSQLKSQLNFIIVAWQQIIECRRVLKWTYAYGYYIPEEEYAKRRLFEYLQGEAESGLERLNQCSEMELQGYLNSDGPSEDFNEFRKKLTGLTNITRTYFKNLVRALENGLSDVDSQGSCSKSESSKKLGGTKGKGKKGKVTKSISSGPGLTVKNSHWCCGHCTYANVDMTSTACKMCELPRL